MVEGEGQMDTWRARRENVDTENENILNRELLTTNALLTLESNWERRARTQAKLYQRH
jgi:hypothetical protein